MKIPYPTLLFSAVLFLGLSCLALLSPLRAYAKPGTALAATLSPTPGTKSSDITLEVTAEPSLVKPRDTLTIKVIVKNTLSRRISGILVTEAIPDFLQLISLKTDVGTNVVKNNTIIFSMTLAAQQVATLTILARVRPTITPPVDGTTTASLVYSQGTLTASESIRVIRGDLPSTGEHPASTLPTSDVILWLLCSLIALLMWRRSFKAEQMLSSRRPAFPQDKFAGAR